MIRLTGLFLILGAKIIFCKALALGIFLLLFFIKGKQLKFNSDRWDCYFLTLSKRKINMTGILIYLAAATFSALLCCFILAASGFQYAFEIALILFAGGILITGYRYFHKGQYYMMEKYKEIPRTILERRNAEKN